MASWPPVLSRHTLTVGVVIVGNILLLLPHHLFLHAPGVTLSLQRQNYTSREGETAKLAIVVIGVSEVDVTARVRLDDITAIREWNNVIA